MAKKNLVSLVKLEDNDKNVLFNSISSKLNILDPKIYNPIYTKIIENDIIDNHIFDSKYKIREVIAKVLEEDKEYGSQADLDDVQSINSNDDVKLSNDTKDIEDMDNDSNVNEEVLNNNTDIDLETVENNNLSEDDDDDEQLDAETEEAINNTFTILGNVEKLNKTTGEKIIKQEKIFVKKSPLLEPLKLMQDIYVIPNSITNKSLDDISIINTNNKLNSYNNSSYVEALFLYLGNKLVEVGKCPTFPYYYGSINGNDPNYYHNITDEYDSVSRNKWFRDRVKNDFDLLIVEDDSEDVNSLINNMYKEVMNRDKTSTDNESNDDDYEDIEENSDSIDKEFSDDDEMLTTDPDNTIDETTGIIELEQTDEKQYTNNNESTIILDGGNILEAETLTDEIIEKHSNNNDFITNLDDVNLDIDLDDNQEDKKEVKEENKDLDFIESLSDFDKENTDISDFEDDGKFKLYYVKCTNMPVNLCLMEHMDKTLDEIIDDGYNMSEVEWFAVFFQVAFGLAVAQKYFNFVHNDLHSDNIMFKSTPMKYLYYEINGKYYRIPTFNKIAKIIDFARGTFKFGDRWVFSDQFNDDGEACGQYDYPVDGSLKNCEFKPNPSFDLVRLGTTVIERLDELPVVTEFVEKICMDDDGHCVCYNEDTFQLYIDIARTCHNAVPIDVLQGKEFNKFKVSKDKIPKGVYVFRY